jgi:hypothetical protein
VAADAEGRTSPADTNAPNPYLGQWYGIRIHVTRQVFAIVHELLEAIESAAKADLLVDPAFLRAVEELLPDARSAWDA